MCGEMARALWSVELESGVLPVVERVRSIICRGEARQVVVFVKLSHAVSCLVNRNSQCRSAVVRHAEDVRTARAECGANVLCVDLHQPTFIGLKKNSRGKCEDDRPDSRTRVELNLRAMRIGEVIGKVSLSSKHPSLSGAKWVLAVPLSREGEEARLLPTGRVDRRL